MSNQIFCSGFPASYPLLRGTQSLSASHRDITRSMLTVGYPSRLQALTQVGRWRAVLLTSMIRGYLDRGLCTTPYFRSLEQSEKAAMSFLLAQAFTHWFAQTHMGLNYVVHVRGATERFTPARGALAMKPGAGPLKPRARPDFIGRASGQYHVFESKGRSSRLAASSMAGALAQASMITTVNGSAPATRVAACFSFGAASVTGQIRDPEAGTTGFDLDFDDVAAAQKAYAFFLQPEIRNSASELVLGFQCVELGDGLIYGVDSDLLSKLDGLRELTADNRSAEPLLGLLQERQEVYAERRSDDTSVGTDGVMLKGDTAPPRALPRIRRRVRQ